MKTRSQSRSVNSEAPPKTSFSQSTSNKTKPVKRLQHDEPMNGFTKVVPRKTPKFSWVVAGVLAAHGRPAKHGHIEYLIQQGVELLITLTENKPRALREYPGEGLEWKHLPVKDEQPPSVEQAIDFVSTVDEAERQGKKVSVHCAWGRGRTGTLSACYLAKRDKLTSDVAIKTIRQLRPGSIDTPQQEATVHQYVELLNKK